MMILTMPNLNAAPQYKATVEPFEGCYMSAWNTGNRQKLKKKEILVNTAEAF